MGRENAEAGSARRWQALRGIERRAEAPMVALGLLWLALLVVELVRGLEPWLQVLATGIWITFIADFLLRLFLAPRKTRYLRSNWLIAISLAIPALRVLRVARALGTLRALRFARGVRLARVLASLNRGMRALGRGMEQRGFGYVAALTSLVLLAGAAGMYAFERAPGGGLRSFGEALWWTAMLLTTIGSEYWPKTLEGRLLALFLSLYALAILGYITALLASFFIGRDAARPGGEVAGQASIRDLQREIERLRADLGLASAESAQKDDDTAPGAERPPESF